MKKFHLGRRTKHILLISLAAISTTSVLVPTVTSCSHVHSDLLYSGAMTKIDESKTTINVNRPLKSNVDQEIIDDVWQNLDQYKDFIANYGIFQNTSLTGSDITIPYSSIEVKRNGWYNYVTMQAYTRTYYFDNAPRILNDTAFPQSGSFGDNTTYRVQLEQKELSDITPKVQNFQLPENKKYLAEKIKTLQWSLTPHLFEYIPKRLDVRDININNASIASADADNNIITLNFTLKCIYNKQGLKEQNFTLYLVSKNYNGPITGTYSASQNSRSTVTAVKEASDSNSSGVVNNQRQWINESECSTAVTFSFKNPVKNPAA